METQNLESIIKGLILLFTLNYKYNYFLPSTITTENILN